MHIPQKDKIFNTIVCNKIQAATGPYEVILATVKKGNYDGSDVWSDLVASEKRSCKADWNRRRGRQKKTLDDNIRERTGLDFNSSLRAVEDRQRWQKIVADVSSGGPTALVVPGHE